MPSPFPGMDPYLEDPARWPDVHAGLIATLRDRLMEQLRPRYVVRAEERVYAGPNGEPGAYRLVRPEEMLRAPLFPVTPESRPRAGGARPVVVPITSAYVHRELFLVVRDLAGEVVTVIEVLSPTNKLGPVSAGRMSYLTKRGTVLASEAHLVEIDLLREGQRSPMACPPPPANPPAKYYVIVSRAERRPDCDVYPVALREALPVVPIPLRREEETEVDLQAVLATAYDRAGYDLDRDYAKDPVPPLGSEDAAWARERVAAWRAR